MKQPDRSGVKQSGDDVGGRGGGILLDPVVVRLPGVSCLYLGGGTEGQEASDMHPWINRRPNLDAIGITSVRKTVDVPALQNKSRRLLAAYAGKVDFTDEPSAGSPGAVLTWPNINCRPEAPMSLTQCHPACSRNIAVRAPWPPSAVRVRRIGHSPHPRRAFRLPRLAATWTTKVLSPRAT